MHYLAWLRHLSITWLKQDYLFINFLFFIYPDFWEIDFAAAFWAEDLLKE